ncbi:UNKNOWN [Stylonychia lemnae]|uniref:Uncharacterized protein n=1 Tax=Stylonychia lemnae TaxID=5949 RepID=A0A077ZYY5_STYLE|nr:UNKNOWN [Stylonychia lemnae]|eukprot:CDW74383.1 UNKNOWN [Stylonychia lemnae]
MQQSKSPFNGQSQEQTYQNKGNLVQKYNATDNQYLDENILDTIEEFQEESTMDQKENREPMSDTNVHKAANKIPDLNTNRVANPSVHKRAIIKDTTNITEGSPFKMSFRMRDNNYVEQHHLIAHQLQQMPEPNDESFAFYNIDNSPSKKSFDGNLSHDSLDIQITEVDGIKDDYIDKYMSNRSEQDRKQELAEDFFQIINDDMNDYIESGHLIPLFRKLYVQQTQVTGQFFLEFLENMYRVKSAVFNRQEWNVEKIDTDEEFLDSNNKRSLLNNAKLTINKEIFIDPVQVKTILEKFVLLNEELGKYKIVGILSRIKEQNLQDMYKDYTFSPQLNSQKLKLQIQSSTNSISIHNDDVVSDRFYATPMNARLNFSKLQQTSTKSSNKGGGLQESILSIDSKIDKSISHLHKSIIDQPKYQDKNSLKNETSQDKIRYSRIQIEKYKDIMDRRDQKKEEILHEMMSECTFRPILSERSLSMAAVSHRSKNANNNSKCQDNFDFTLARDNSNDKINHSNCKNNSAKQVIENSQQEFECTFQPKINKQDEKSTPVWQQDLEKPRGFEKQVSRYKRAIEVKEENKKILDNMGKPLNYSGQPTIFSPFKFFEREKLKSTNKNLEGILQLDRKGEKNMFTFDIKIKKDKIIKLKISDYEDKSEAVQKFCNFYKLGKEREDIITNEVKRFFERKVLLLQQQQLLSGYSENSSQNILSAKETPMPDYLNDIIEEFESKNSQ